MFRRFCLCLSLVAAFSWPAQAAIQTNAEHALLMDAQTGQVLWQKDGMTPMAPASMSKLMSIELLFQRLKDGRVKMSDTFPVSERAWRTPGSRSFAELGARIPVEDLVRGIVIQSGNDFCIVVAEALGGTVEGFVAMMNKRAKELGLAQSRFVNPDGLPDPPGQLMSAHDLAKLSRHLINTYPHYYRYFAEKTFTWHGISQPNRNLVLDTLPGADGLKTGHTDLAGYGITVSAKRGAQRLILVVNGLRYPQYKNDYFPNIRRAEEATRIMEMAFREFRSYPVLTANQIVSNVPVADGALPAVPVTAAKPLNLTLQVDSRSGLKTTVKPDPGLKAPIHLGQKVGVLVVTAPEFPAYTVPVFATQSVNELGFFGRLWNSIKRKIGK
ncbi:MAG TPA: D-alanyl-D-alanine carboxypeptidase family protein [Rhizomicrobium sp.]|nr:D-alanyl-D-alanine carboxypeptidase family protein [Rhizomicrobium sp.]